MLAVCLALIDDEKDKAEFEGLYYEYKDLMMHTAYKHLKNQEDVEDAVAEAFFRIACNFDRIDRKICAKTANQLVMILRNIIIDRYRVSKKNGAQDIHYNGDIEDDSFDDYDAAEIKMCFKELKDDDKDVLYWYYIYGYSIKTIVKLLDSNENAVKKRIYRAKQRLMEKLSPKECRRK